MVAILFGFRIAVSLDHFLSKKKVEKFGFRMVRPFENGPSKRSEFEWIQISGVRYSSPHCTWALEILYFTVGIRLPDKSAFQKVKTILLAECSINHLVSIEFSPMFRMIPSKGHKKYWGHNK